MMATGLVLQMAVAQLFIGVSMAQNNLYSLQPAVDALHRREAQLWLDAPQAFRQHNEDRQAETNQRYNNGAWSDEENAFNGELDTDQFMDERKRSMFRERGEAPRPSAFRERELTQPELAAQFLEAIERERNAEREQLHKDQLHQLWQKYQQQENDLEEELYEHEMRNHRRPTAIRGTPIGPAGELYDNRNHRPPISVVTTPIGWGPFEPEQPDEPSDDEYALVAEKRRLVMPWLPVRKRSSPMSKRSSASALLPSYHKAAASISGTDERVAHDLQAIFSDTPTAMKSKRSSGTAAMQTTVKEQITDASTPDTSMPPATAAAIATIATKAPAATAPVTTATSSSVSGATPPLNPTGQYQRDQGDDHDLDHDGYLAESESSHAARQHAHKHEHKHLHDHRGNDDDSSHEHDHEHDDEHDDDAHEHDDDEDAGDDEEDSDEHDDRKRKRAATASTSTASAVMSKRGNQEVLKEDQIIPGDLNDFKRKKSIEWSKYFGIDRKKKSTEWSSAATAEHKQKTLEDYTPTHFRNHDQVVARPKPVDVNERKLDNMDQKLRTIEELIIDETIKYTEEHEGITNPEDIEKLRENVISRLATAYSLEKMRRALEKLKHSVDLERHLGQNEVEKSRSSAMSSENDSAETLDKSKRVAIKKEKVQYDNSQHSIDSASEHNLNNGMKVAPNDERYKDQNDEQGVSINHTPEKKNFYVPMINNQNEEHAKVLDYNNNRGAGAFESTIDQYVPIDEFTNNAMIDDDCPILDAMEKRCRAVNLLSNDVHQQFLPLCGVHQLCYLCGTSQAACDYQYMEEVSSICENNEDCQMAARTALMMLRDTPGPQVGPRKCARNSCLKRALMDLEAL